MSAPGGAHSGSASELSQELKAACAAGDADAVSRLLEAGVSAVVDSNAPIKVAAANGHLDIVDTLLALSRVNAATDHNEPLRAAAANGHTAVVQRLLSIRGVDPTAANNSAIRSACANGHLPLAKLLLGCGRGVDPSAEKSEALRLAAANGHVEVMRELLAWKNPSGKGGKKGGVDVTACEHEAIRMAAANGHTAVVAELLSVPGVDASALDSFALRRAAAGGHHEIVSMLMRASKRVDPTANACEALIAACASGHLAVVENLLAPRPSAWPCIAAGDAVDNAFCAAVRGGHEDVALRLLPVPLPPVDSVSGASGSVAPAASGLSVPFKSVAAAPAAAGGAGAAATGHAPRPRSVSANLSSVRRRALRAASAAGLERVVHFLLPESDGRAVAVAKRPWLDDDDTNGDDVTPLAAVGEALVAAAEHNRLSIVSMLLDRLVRLVAEEGATRAPPRAAATIGEPSDAPTDKVPLPRVVDAFEAAAANGHDAVLELLLPHVGDPAVYLPLDDLLAEAALKNHAPVADRLMGLGASLAAANFGVFRRAACVDDLPTLQRLTKMPGVDVHAAGAAALCTAAGYGALDCLEYLLVDIGVNPAADDCRALSNAVAGQKRSAAAVARLLADPRVDPSINDNGAMQTAVECGSIGAVLLLMADPRVDASRASGVIRIAKRETGLRAFPEMLEHTVAWRHAAVCSEFSAAMRAALKDVAESEAKGPSRRALIAAADAPVDAKLIPDLRRAFNLTVITRPNWERRRVVVMSRAMAARAATAAAGSVDIKRGK